MIPQLRLSSEPVVADFQSAELGARARLQDFERGGVAIGDVSQGLDVQDWELRVFGQDVLVRPFPAGSYSLVFKEPGITAARLAFDQSMRPAVLYEVGEATFLYYFDSVSGSSVKRLLPGVRDARITLDDKRPGLLASSDILLFYLKDDVAQQPQRLYMRAQRDRFDVEYMIGFLPRGANALDEVGMAENNRIRISLFGLFAPQPETPRDPLPFPPEAGLPNELIMKFNSAFYLGGSPVVTINMPFRLYRPPVTMPWV